MIRQFCESCNICKYCDDVLLYVDDASKSISRCLCEESPDTGYCCPNVPMTDCEICKKCEYLIFCFKNYYYGKK